MKIDGLTIGSWVISISKFCPVRINKGSDIDNHEDYEPIELTQAILGSCSNGFTKVTTETQWGSYEEYRYHMGPDLRQYNVEYRPEAPVKILVFGVELKYLHDLQNIHLFHTKKELKLPFPYQKNNENDT